MAPRPRRPRRIVRSRRLSFPLPRSVIPSEAEGSVRRRSHTESTSTMRLLPTYISVIILGTSWLSSFCVAQTKGAADTLDQFGQINGLIPVLVTLHEDGKIQISGDTLTIEKARVRLLAIGNSNPAQPVLLVANEKIRPNQVQEIIDMCKSSHLSHLVRVTKEPVGPIALPSQSEKPTTYNINPSRSQVALGNALAGAVALPNSCSCSGGL
jgi:hypothetical protein